MMKLGVIACAGTICLLAAVTLADSRNRPNIILCETSGNTAGEALAKEITNKVATETVDCATTMEKRQNSVFVAHGISSARGLLSNIALGSEQKIIAGLYKTEYQRLAADYPFAINVTAIANDPSPRSQLILAKSLFPISPRLLLLFSAKSLPIRNEYLQHAEALGVEIVEAEVKQEADALRHIAAKLDVDAVLAIPDQSIYNKFTLPILLRSSYEANIPLLGFSSQFVRVGALATTYTSVEALADRVLANVNHWSVARLAANDASSDITSSLISDQSGVEASVCVNRSVSNSLSIVVPKTASLEQHINHMRELKRD